jgi:sialidase-1
MKSQRIITALTNISTVTMLVFLYLFLSGNAPGLTALYLITAIAAVYALAYLGAAGVLLQTLSTEALSTRVGQGSRAWPSRIVLLLSSATLLYVFLDATVTDYYQPLSLYDDAIGLLALWWGMLILQNLIGLFSPAAIAQRLALLSLAALVSWPLAASLWWINSPEPGADVAENSMVFQGGEDGYDIYRIPGLVLIPAGSTLANGDTLESDRLLAFAEARRDGSLDTGAIDLVLKTSGDSGKQWSAQTIVCRHQIESRHGKCGNPTPLFDRQSGLVVLAYNLSGLDKDTGHHSAHIMSSRDGGKSWDAPRQLASDNFVFGPGKGIQKLQAPNAGRLLLPGYAGGKAHVYYSDDQGQSWHRDPGLPGGNETDVAELADGRVYLATRHNAPIAKAPEPNGRLFSISTDGGVNWPDASLDESLPTPVCQVSILTSNDGGLLFSNPAHPRARVQMTIRYSNDMGQSWPAEVLVYPGPAGYSVLAQGSRGDIFLLYENGNMAYSERISMARIARDNLLPSPPSN